MKNWAESKQMPGQFTGSTGVKVLSPAELHSGYQAWARKVNLRQYFINAPRHNYSRLILMCMGNVPVTDPLSSMSNRLDKDYIF